jgi:hypothetical protein
MFIVGTAQRSNSHITALNSTKQWPSVISATNCPTVGWKARSINISFFIKNYYLYALTCIITIAACDISANNSKTALDTICNDDGQQEDSVIRILKYDLLL